MAEPEFNTLTEAYNLLADAEIRRQALAQKLEADFKEPNEKFFVNPLSHYELDLEHVLQYARTKFADFITGQLNREYENLEIDRKEVEKFVEESKKFDAQEVINYIRQVYADVDGISYQQILKTCKTLLPWGDFGGKRCAAYMPEHIPTINADGIELRIYGQGYEQKERVSVFLKLVDIVLRGAKPSQAEGRRVGLGEVYRDDRIKSLRYFKNSTLKVLFHSAEDAEKVKAALVSEGVTA